MKKYLLAAMMLLALIAVAACNGNGDTPETQEVTTTQNENNQIDAVHTETPVEDLPGEELKIQIDAATDELLSTFTNLHRVDIRIPGDSEGVTLVVWANQALPSFAVITLTHDLLEDSDEWGFRPTDSFGSVEMLLPGEAFVIENYTGLGTLPHRGISFSGEHCANTRVFAFQENHAYPEHGGQWIIQEIEAERIIWTSICWFEPPSDRDYTIIINGVEFSCNVNRNAPPVYTMPGEQHPTHITFSVIGALGLDAISGGSQHSLQHENGAIRVAVGIDDTFMAEAVYCKGYLNRTPKKQGKRLICSGLQAVLWRGGRYTTTTEEIAGALMGKSVEGEAQHRRESQR